MRILSLTNCPLDPSLGSGKTVLTFTNGLRELGHECEAHGPESFELCRTWRKARKFRQALGAWRFLKQRVDISRFDLVEFYGDEFWLATRWLSRRQSRPFLVAHTNGLELLAGSGDEKRDQGPSVGQFLYGLMASQTHARFSWMAFRSADAFVSLCETDRAFVVANGVYRSEHARVIPPGLDAEYLGRANGGRRDEAVAFTGSWIPRKGTAQLVHVMSALMRARPGLRFDVLGAGTAKAQIFQAFPAALHAQVVVHGKLANAEMAAVLSKAKVFFFPPRYEGYGMALAEAMGCGGAAVTTPTGFGGDLSPGVDGMVCDRDDTAGMQQAILRLLDDEPERARLAENGWRRVQSLRWEDSVKRLEQTYLEWIAEWRSSLRSDRRSGGGARN